MGFTQHELKAPLKYVTEVMSIVNKDDDRLVGMIGHVISNGTQKVFIDPADDYNLTSYLSDRTCKIVGRGVAVEKVWVDEWVIAWRPYEDKPEVIVWKE